MSKQRVDRLNSLLKEVISDVIKTQVRNPHVNELLTVTRVDITKDLHHAKVYISVIGNQQTKNDTLHALKSAAGFIASQASQQVVMHHFPALNFIFDDSVEKHMRIADLLGKISDERKSRPIPDDEPSPGDESDDG